MAYRGRGRIPTRKKATKTQLPKGYDSKFEVDIHALIPNLTHHPDKVHYVQHRTYEPDFIYERKEGGKFKVTLIECKGRFRDSAEAKKYKDVRDSLEDNYEIVFVFYNPKTPMPHARKRKDGTKLTHGGWADKEGFTWYTAATIPTQWKR